MRRSWSSGRPDPPMADASLEQRLAEALQEIEALRQELDETNQGVLALYAELDDRALRLKRADDLKSRFLSYASHELRTPLNGIVGLTRLLLARKPQGEELRQILFIQQAVHEMRAMVDDLLDLAKVEAGKITVHPSAFGLELVFGALRGMFRPLLSPDTVELHFEDTSAIPSVFTDEAKVRQILQNFISNALKFTEKGEIRVWAEAGSENTVRIAVKDTGIGIAPKDQPRVFEEFAQIETPLQKKVKGTGLGLPLCKRLAELLGGCVELASQPGVGSTFTLILPRVYTPAQTGIPAPQSARTFTVLHVEDEEIDRYLVQNLLRFPGDLRLLHALDGQEALEIVHRERPNLIILDLNLPRISGADVLTALAEMPEMREIPVAILTARKLEDVDPAAHTVQVVAILSKEALADAEILEISEGPPVSVTIH
jgi:signal transduction histidine kinase